MGHTDAQRRKVELGLCRDLDPYDTRSIRALQWMVRWGFSTSKILNQIFLSKNDLAKMEFAGLVENFQIGFKKTKDSRPIPTVIWFPSKKGRMVGKVGDYLGKRYPSIELASHDLICQAFVADRLARDSVGSTGTDIWPARMIAKTGVPGIDLAQHLPDAVYFDHDRSTTYVLEVERNPILIKRSESSVVERFKFVEKLSHLIGNGFGDVNVTLLYMTAHQAEKTKAIFEGFEQEGYPEFYVTDGQTKRYWANNEYVDGELKQVNKALSFSTESLNFESLESRDLSKWLP